MNNVTVGRSILECLRLLEAFQAVSKHGVLCPVDWKPDAAEDKSTASNTLTESYDGRLAQLQREFGDIPVTDLDSKHNVKAKRHRNEEPHKVEPTGGGTTPSLLSPPGQMDQLGVPHSNSAPASTSATPVSTPAVTSPPSLKKSSSGTARHSRGKYVHYSTSEAQFCQFLYP